MLSVGPVTGNRGTLFWANVKIKTAVKPSILLKKICSQCNDGANNLQKVALLPKYLKSNKNLSYKKYPNN